MEINFKVSAVNCSPFTEKKPLVYQVILMQEAHLNSKNSFKLALTPVIKLDILQYFSPCNSPRVVFAADHISRLLWTFLLLTDHAGIHPPRFCCGTVAAFSLWRSFTWMLLECPVAGEGGVSARVLTALFWNYITTSSESV